MNALLRGLLTVAMAATLAAPSAVSAHGSSGFGFNNARSHAHSRNHERHSARNQTVEICHGRGWRQHCHRIQGNRAITLGNVRPHHHDFGRFGFFNARSQRGADYRGPTLGGPTHNRDGSPLTNKQWERLYPPGVPNVDDTP